MTKYPTWGFFSSIPNSTAVLKIFIEGDNIIINWKGNQGINAQRISNSIHLV